jgi:4-diphosphocytidyl-2-C-methyl-D-erythritol kinase
MMSVVEMDSPAKINLYLHVTGKRADGYHTLRSMMCCIDWYDRLIFDFGTPKISVTCVAPHVPEDRRNIAWQAAEVFFKALQKTDGVHVTIKKRIPVGAGLGGGSSNAASVLKALNTYYHQPFTMEELMQMGVSLGADVPFFIFGKPAIATGIGEQLNACELYHDYYFLLVYPGIYVSTADVYKAFDFCLTKDKKINTKHNSLKIADASGTFLENDLERAAFSMNPKIQTLKKVMLEAGAKGALMSGSGSTVFGLFDTWEDAVAAGKWIRQWGGGNLRGGWRLHLSRMVHA